MQKGQHGDVMWNDGLHKQLTVTARKLKLAFDILKYCSKGWPRKSNIWVPQGNVSCAVGIMKAQPNQLCIRILNKCISLFSIADTRKQNSTISNHSWMCWFCLHWCFPTQPHQVPLGHLLKWLNPADRNLIYILLFVTLFSYNSLDSWMKT